jgi:peptidoglycan/LPS O-acetylase OafA/YrhL
VFVVPGAASSLSAGDLLPGGVPFSDFIPRFVFLFLFGVVAFQRRTGLIGVVEYGALLAVATGGAILTVGAPAAVAGLLAVAVIGLYGQGRSFLSGFCGKISYSLYLLHWPLGHLTLSVLGLKLLRAEGDAARILVLFVALGVCLASAYLLHVLVEWPSQRWAAHLGYGQAPRRVSPSLG